MKHAARNIELKCRCRNLDSVREKAKRLGAKDAGVLGQQDTFFHAQQARLKLRDFGDGRGELIGYQRPDTAEARGSDYFICSTSSPDQLSATLAFSLGVSGAVKKVRHIFLYRNTRIHLDDVEGLGTFVELETVLSGQSDREGHDELQEVAVALGLNPGDCVSEPYVELLRRIRPI